MAIFTNRLRALIRKEFGQIRRDRRLAASLILPPTLQLLLLGFALSANVTNIKLGAVDDSRTPDSRELLSRLSESAAFRLVSYYDSVNRLGEALSRNAIDAGVVIPHDYGRDLQRRREITVQLLLNAMNANTATISEAYAQAVLQSYSASLQAQGPHTDGRQAAASSVRGRPQLHPAYLYNPGLRDSWFIVTGVFGLLLILNSSLVAAGTMVKEREAGTLEQLLMAPATTWEIVLAKIAPLFVLLFLMSIVASGVMKVAFGVPFHGRLPLVLCGAALCILSGISIGTVNATFSKSAQQAQLMAFFINPPINATAGALSPVEAMPGWMQPITIINPIHHFAVIARAGMLKGSGFSDLWPNFLALLAITTVLSVLSLWRFRKQLS
jgi:ABC-2 type transport system permease protein